MVASTSRFSAKELNKSIYRANGLDKGGDWPRNAYYSLYGWHDKVDGMGYPRCSKDDQYLAHTFKHSVYQSYKVAVDDDNNLYKPGPDKAPSGYVLTNETAFRFYLNFLKTADAKWLTIAEVERQARTSK